MDKYYTDNCYICLEKTSIYFKLNNCKCSIYCHDDCFRNIQKQNKCIICKKDINNTLLLKKINDKVDNIFILKIMNKLYNNFLINSIARKESNFYLILFVFYSITISLLTISLSFIFLFCQIFTYSYYYLKYKSKIYNNYEKIYICDKIK